MSIQAQETVTVKFTAATAAGGYSPFTSVMVTDLTQGWMMTLNYPDTVLVLTSTQVGVGEWQGQDCRLGAAFPNPFAGKTCVPLELEEASEVSLQVIRVDGKVVATRDMCLARGAHDVTVCLSTPGMAFLRVATPHGSSVARLVCTGHAGADEMSVVPKDVAVGRGGNPGVFELGDLMRYEAFLTANGTTVHSTVVEQKQYNNETVTLVFPVEAPVGAIDGLFTINDEGAKVYFSKGNLQYHMNTGTWSFMEHQYDMVEYLNQDVGENYANQNIVSLFGWGTSGYDHGANCYLPWSTSSISINYYAYGSWNYNLNDSTGKADWGYNAISNGGNRVNSGWRTLTQSEWDYVFNTRGTASGIHYAKANVNGVNGVILLPDNWTTSTYTLSNTNNSAASYDSNNITAANWTNVLEANGAVFLPAAGYRSGTEVDAVDRSGYYCSASFGSGGAYTVSFNNGSLDNSPRPRGSGQSVRLVGLAAN